MEEKYIELLLKRCLQVSKKTPLFISFKKINRDFVDKVVIYAKEIGVSDIYLDEEDSNYIHEFLKSASIDEISKSAFFNCKIWDEYAEKNAAFLMIDSEIPKLMNDIDAEKLAKASYMKRTTKPVYIEKQLNSEIAWCIACVPNEYWAKDIFPNSKDSVKDFWKVLSKICMFDKGNPIERWNELLNKQSKMQEKLNKLKISKLYFKNSLGTDLEIELSDKALWESASSGKWIVNLPSYEIFTAPNYKKTKGIVYSSRPLIYNGKVIDNFYIKFENGKVVDYNAKKGKNVLKGIIESDKYSSYLGEVALVNYNSPISNTNLVFKSTLIDENASCHLAFGSGYLECIEGYKNMDKKELEKIGLNSSKNHVDFMIGSEDLKVEADTKDGRITIMENGNIVL